MQRQGERTTATLRFSCSLLSMSCSPMRRERFWRISWKKATMEAEATAPSPLTSSSLLEAFLSPLTPPNSPSVLKLLVSSWWK
ncbi:hypothetical protein PIB30_083783 [Stylosanthes scabra]|uniref:Secreted protein n=1 Tax=Stylosanthes scabra TaxID=79078 RepID=A0ABU6TT50_9FABA|nr:hypothetical protein [Stylosanthes scabra]